MNERLKRIGGKAKKLAELKIELEAKKAAKKIASALGKIDLSVETGEIAALGTGCLPFYGRVNTWSEAGREELNRDIALCSCRRVNYLIELAGWSGGAIYDSPEVLSRTLADYSHLLAACRKAGLLLHVSLCNWNITQSKYGNKGRSFKSTLDVNWKLVEAIKAAGPDNQIIQPVAETGKEDDVARNFEKAVGTSLAGFRLCYNGDGGSPSKSAHGWPYFAQHPSGSTKAVAKGCMAISDHGTLIRQLAADGALDGPGDPAKILQWFKHVKGCGAILAGYYAFQRVKHDSAAIAACGAAFKE